MIVYRKRDARYHLAYLKTLTPIRSDESNDDDELLNDGVHRLFLSRLTVADGAEADNMVRIELNRSGKGDWQVTAEYPADTGPVYCLPGNCGLASTASAVASKITALLKALAGISSHGMDGGIVDDCDAISLKIIYTLLAQGWRIRATDNGWKALPPRDGVRNDNAPKTQEDHHGPTK